LLVYCQQLQRHYIYSNSCVHGSIPSNGNWFNKVRSMSHYFTRSSYEKVFS
jgi:uncharacterized protein (UPF0303 family)